MMEKTATVTLPAGPIKVRVLDDLVHARAIPYAKALRFERPQYTDNWTEVLNCTRHAAICPQLPSRLESVMGPLTKGHALEEDCLHLSITAPKDARDAPVMIWLHGGAYISGGGDLDCYQPIDLARRGIVCVNVTYRLGVFGYLRLEGIAPANLGLLDQRAALLWVQNNIAAFGGNPNNVTMVGQSAGADSIVCLMAAQETPGRLFHRAILLSPPLRDLKERKFTGALLSQKAEHLLTQDPRKMTVDELLAFQKKLLLDPVEARVMLFAPSFGFDPLPEEKDFDERISEAASRVPILIGWTTHDGRPFASMMGPSNLLKLPIIGSFLEKIGTWYITQSYFKWPSQRFHQQILDAGGSSTTYSFGWTAENSTLGACHCIDIPFVLGSYEAWKSAPMLAGKDTEKAISDLGSQIQEIWTRFMRGEALDNRHIEFERYFIDSRGT
jgi:para-nitrobenzyl esterase